MLERAPATVSKKNRGASFRQGAGVKSGWAAGVGHLGMAA